MNLLRLLPALLLLPLAHAQEAVVPEPFPPTRYAKLTEESPFALATPVVKEAEPEPNWAVNLYLGPVSREFTEDGMEVPVVSVKSKNDPTAAFTLVGSEATDGVQIVKVEWADNPRNTKVVVKKGTEFATLTVNEADFTAPPPPPQPPRGPQGTFLGQQRQPGMAPGAPAPAGNGVIRRPVQGGAPVQSIPRPTITAPPALQGPKPATAPSNDRRRIRSIGSEPRS